METILTWLGVAMAPLYMASLIGGPMLLVDWLRRRRQEAINLQIMLTNTFDEQLGPIVSPVVKQSLWGAWQVQIAVPFDRPDAIGTILALSEETLSAAGRMSPDQYRIVLTIGQARARKEWGTRALRRANGWAGGTIVATR
jgi:hypothetical protein